MDTHTASCSICGLEHDTETSPDNDSTHLCPDCADAQHALRHPARTLALPPKRALLVVLAVPAA